MVGEEGFVSFAESSFDSLRNKDFVPPEWNPRQYFTDEEVEKVMMDISENSQCQNTW